MSEPGGTKRLRMPPLHHYDGSMDISQLFNSEHKWQLPFMSNGMRVEHKKVDVILIFAARLPNVLAMLAHQKFMQFEVFADNGFAYGSHGFITWLLRTDD